MKWLLHCVAIAGTLAALSSGAESLQFVASTNVSGEFTFDTGVLRGKLRAHGRAIGLSSVVHVRSGQVLDQGDRAYGLFSHYRVFGNGRRFGGGAWDWSGAASLSNGVVRVHWPATPDRPFDMGANYRWKSPTELDLITWVNAHAPIKGFEVFLASYFNPAFTNCLARVGEWPKGSGQTGWMPVEKANGDWQMFPRDEAAVKLIQDGRWQLPPNPVKWELLPQLARPCAAAVRRAPATDITAVMYGHEDQCFAIAAPHQAEGHYSTYLSLFGCDLRQGQTHQAQTILAIEANSTERTLEKQFTTLKTSHTDR